MLKMKKIIISCLIGLFFLATPTQLIKADEEIYDDNIELVNRSAVIRKWFSEQPPKTYKGKSLLSFYYKNKGYIGIYK